jgi:3-hydroxyacyl-CoA dehydrogenase
MVSEAALLLAEDVAQRATDIDVVMANGFGFPRTRGGPVYWARERGAESLANDMDWLSDLSGPGFVRGDLRRLVGRETGIEEAST